MYQQVQTHALAYLENGITVEPVATLEDECGGRAHIWVNDHCYVLGLERQREGPVKPQVYAMPTTYIFPEAFLVLKTLPDQNPT